jgi:hypothetical protein
MIGLRRGQKRKRAASEETALTQESVLYLFPYGNLKSKSTNLAARLRAPRSRS